MPKTVRINKKPYVVNDDEFNSLHHDEYNNLKLVEGLGSMEQLIGLIKDLAEDVHVQAALFVNPTHGGFIPIQCASQFQHTTSIVLETTHKQNTLDNKKHHQSNVRVETSWTHALHNDGVKLRDEWRENKTMVVTERLLTTTPLFNQFVKTQAPFLLCQDLDLVWYQDFCLDVYEKVYYVPGLHHYLYVPQDCFEAFYQAFHCYIDDATSELRYDNLLHLCIMVKNGGPQFEATLQENKDVVDRWTVLDTGSTDETVDIVKRVLTNQKKGDLYEEPFLNFRDSRNRCLDLASTKCKFIVFLDDTYVLKNNLRQFLQTIRSDQFADSYSLFIKSNDSEYASNRIIKSESGLRYMYRIHEVISDKNNINVIVPLKDAHILDKRFDYMEQRTMERKHLDLQLLFEEVEDNPMEPRTYYYLGQTYNLLGNFEKAYQFYLKRASFNNAGFIQERIDALFEAGRIAQFQLKKPWPECLDLYERAYKADESRPDSLYFMGVYYFGEGDVKKAFPYLKKAFEIGFPTHCQYSLKPALSFYFLPKLLARMCYDLEEYHVGEAASRLFLVHNTEPQNPNEIKEMESWFHIYHNLNKYQGPHVPKKPCPSDKPLFCFVADGGFTPWTGKNILTTGVGGSETYIIEMARYIQRHGRYQVVVFCNCETEDTFEGVWYKPILTYFEFINTTAVDHCIVSRYSEYLPVTYKGWAENVYLVVHDLCTSGVIIPMDRKLKQIFCLTEWHVAYFTQIYPILTSITVPFYYGIDFTNFRPSEKKVPYEFIYSSFANRGLIVLLEMWPQIMAIQPEASLHIYCDVNNSWVNNVAKEQMERIRMYLAFYEKHSFYHVHYHGWVSKQTLARAWSTADIWFYPCVFQETFCLTALEAAWTRTFVMSNHLAALQNTVGNRGLVIPGDPFTMEWKETALQQMAEFIGPHATSEKRNQKQQWVDANYEWARNLSWEQRATTLLQHYIFPQNQLQSKGLFFPLHDYALFQHVMDHVLQHFKTRETRVTSVLEVGTFTGITLISFVSSIPHSTGVGIDRWVNAGTSSSLVSKYTDKQYRCMEENNVEEAFRRNVSNVGLQSRIQGIKGDSYTVLGTFMENRQGFDLVYVDGSEEDLDFHTDLLFSWKIVNKGGCLIVNNVRRNYNIVERFLESERGNLATLERGNREEKYWFTFVMKPN